MTATPLQTITDALIEFILSLLRDPDAAAEFNADPEETLASRGLGNVCADDVRAVVPVIVDRPDVLPRPPAPQPPPPAPHPPHEPTVVVVEKPPAVVEEISRVTNSFHIDNRSTIVDQSVNQSIWAEGDVMQLFDQEAVLAAGDEAMAAGGDATVDSSNSDTQMGDVSVGNTETTTHIEDSFNDESIDVDINDGHDDADGPDEAAEQDAQPQAVAAPIDDPGPVAAVLEPQPEQTLTATVPVPEFEEEAPAYESPEVETDEYVEMEFDEA